MLFFAVYLLMILEFLKNYLFTFFYDANHKEAEERTEQIKKLINLMYVFIEQM